MRALLSIFIAAAALCAAGCASGEPTDRNRATLVAVTASKDRLTTLSTRIDANQLETQADVDAYVSDMRSTAGEEMAA